MLSPLISIATLLTALGPGGSEPTAPRNDSIRQQDLKADLFFLAGDRFRGRLTATPENDLASEFIAVAVRAAGTQAGRGEGRTSSASTSSTASLGPSSSSEDRAERRRPGSTPARSRSRCRSAPAESGR